LQTFCSEDLGAFYLDILKDRLYTCAKESSYRRSAQNALWHITQGLVRLMAPILSFTAEEAWRVVHSGDETVFAQTFYAHPDPQLDESVRNAWRDVRNLREMVSKRLEEKREAKQIGSSLAAELDIEASGDLYGSLARLGDELRFVFITSRATLRRLEGAPVTVTVTPSKHLKCARCWHWRADVGADPKHPEICSRCVSNLFGAGEPRRFA
jgi:isoleucyl-tRNA synthetase